MFRMASVVICMACLFRSTIGEIVKLIDIAHEGWSTLLEEILYFTRRLEFPTFLRYFLYIMPTTSLHGLSATYLLGMSL